MFLDSLAEDLQEAIQELETVRAQFDLVEGPMIDVMCTRLKAAEMKVSAIVRQHRVLSFWAQEAEAQTSSLSLRRFATGRHPK